MPKRPYGVLFPCARNSARLLKAEALLNRDGEDWFHGYSAGSLPKGAPQPMIPLFAHSIDMLDSLAFKRSLQEIGVSDGRAAFAEGTPEGAA